MTKSKIEKESDFGWQKENWLIKSDGTNCPDRRLNQGRIGQLDRRMDLFFLSSIKMWAENLGERKKCENKISIQKG